MSLTLIWSRFAELQLAEIHNYYTEEAGGNVAKKITAGIIKAPHVLLRNPELGPKEPDLSDLQIEYRYIVYKSYKIIYSIDRSASQIRIADVFDTRQHPKKLKSGK